VIITSAPSIAEVSLKQQHSLGTRGCKINGGRLEQLIMCSVYRSEATGRRARHITACGNTSVLICTGEHENCKGTANIRY